MTSNDNPTNGVPATQDDLASPTTACPHLSDKISRIFTRITDPTAKRGAVKRITFESRFKAEFAAAVLSAGAPSRRKPWRKP